jgi:hypothetical protein
MFEFISAIFKIFPKVKWAAIIGVGLFIFGDDLGRSLGYLILIGVIVFIAGAYFLNEEVESSRREWEKRKDRK